MDDGQHRAAMDAKIAEGATPGSPDGPGWARGCDKCQFGIISQPKLDGCGVPYFIARAMAIDLDGMCYVVYCDCKAGDIVRQRDENEREKLKLLPVVISVVQSKDEYGHSVLSWGAEEPPDCIPGNWWHLVRKACGA